jgi:hypothetical protein
MVQKVRHQWKSHHSLPPHGDQGLCGVMEEFDQQECQTPKSASEYYLTDDAGKFMRVVK